MSVKKKVIILVVSLIGITGIIIGVSYAFFSIGGVQDTANTFNSGCLNISLTNESTSINLTDAYPITDVEGLETTSYDFTVKNNCNSATNYQINLESLNEQVNSLNADYIKVSLSSDTVDNVISILSSNTSATPSIDNAYESYNLYTDSLDANEEKTYHLKIWVDYDATVEQAASRVYSSKINVIANPETTVVDTLEAKFSLSDTTLTANLTNNVTSASYCTTTGNICTPNISATIENNSYIVELGSSADMQIVCTQLNGTSKIICSNPNKITAKDVILADNPTIDNSRSGEITGILTDNTTGTLFTAEDDYGTSYFYAGDVDNNWVSFAGFYWRIIRINGDGSIRMIYSGNSESGLVETGEATQIGTSAFNGQTNDNAYVGYMYGTAGSSTYEETHVNINDSTIKTVLDTWYQENLLSYSEYISTETGFCNDRRINTTDDVWWEDDTKTGYGTNATAYAPFSRHLEAVGNIWKTNLIPILKCSQSNDYFTVNESSMGNHKLTYPIGLINSDEVVLAGGLGGSNNTSYYLYTNQAYWTMSPSNFVTELNLASVFLVNVNGDFDDWYVNGVIGVRPVINLASNVQITGSGTISDPYTVVEN